MSARTTGSPAAAVPADPAGGPADGGRADGGAAHAGTTGGKQGALLTAAARILVEEGSAAVSVRRVAAAAGTSTMAVYTWYGGKPQLMRALFREAFSQFGDRLLAESAGASPLGALAGLGRAYRGYALAEPDLYTVMFGRDSGLFDPGPEDLLLATGTFEILVAAVARCVDAGALRCDPRQGAWCLWAAAHGAVSLELAQRAPGGAAPPDGYEQAPARQMIGGQGGAEAFGAVMRTALIGLGASEASLRDGAPGRETGDAGPGREK
jgi:AcrR family transcriptional regulator